MSNLISPPFHTQPHVSDDPWFKFLSMLLLGSLAAIFSITFLDYGYSWEEIWHNIWYGKAIVSFFGTFGEDNRAIRYLDLQFYGGLYDTIVELIAWLTSLDGFMVRRACNASLGLFSFIGVWKTGNLLAGSRGGFWSLLFLATMPAYYGHIFFNAKDIPVATGTIWSIYYLIRLSSTLPNPGTRDLIRLGLAMGLAMGVRIGGIILIAYAGLMLLLGMMMVCVNGSRFPVNLAKISWVRIVGIPLAIAFLLMIVFWPAVLHDPRVLIESFESARHHIWGKTVLLNGNYIKGEELPWGYLPTYFSITLPELFEIAFLLAIPWGLFNMIKGWMNGNRLLTQGLFLLFVSIFFTPIYAIVNHATLYDGTRHFLFIIPPMAVLCGVALTSFSHFLTRYPRIIRYSLAGMTIIYFSFHIYTMAQLHPYQYTYYNRFIGGLPGAANRFETEYWITSYREAADLMVAHAKKQAAREGVDFQKRHFTVGVAFVAINIQSIIPPNMTVLETSKIKDPDYIISTTRWNTDRQFDAMPTIARVERQGVVFSVVKAKNP